MTGRIHIPAEVPDCPAWAGGFGVDCHGVFADLVWGEHVYRLRWIPPGGFEMGSLEGEVGEYSDEKPRHPVRITDGFWLGETPVTQDFYKAITGKNPAEFKGEVTRPVEQVSWEDSREFCEILTNMLPGSRTWRARLPGEAEWEYACRAETDGALYSDKPLTSEFGSCPNLDELAWYDKNSGAATHPVKEKTPNKWGLYDMLGNVWEWCEDHWHENYEGAPNDGKPWVETDDEGLERVFRGGSWFHYARFCRAACRFRFRPDFRDVNVGFRLVLAPGSTGQVPSLEQGR